MSSVLFRGVIRNGRVEVDEPIDLPEGTEVVATFGTIGPDNTDAPASPVEIAHVLAAMHQSQPLEIPDHVGADLDAWERELNQRGLDNTGTGIEDVFR